MVFEGTLSAVLNRFLGDFVENLDGQQLNVGIWGGNVKLRNLVIKPSALNELDLPVQTVYGTIGQLILKIPWKSLYTSPWIIDIDKIILLVEPNQQIEYDPDKEEKTRLEAKKKEIQRIEDAKKAEADKGKPKADPGFAEKLVATIINNVQLTIRNIHIRYEDKITNPTAPFTFGISLHSLVAESADSKWQKAITSDVTKVYKIIGLEALAVYLNCNSKLHGQQQPTELIAGLIEGIAAKDHKIPGFQYVLGPINASARLKMNQTPENDRIPFTDPKIHLNLDMEKLFIGVSKAQYRNIIALADSMERMSKGIPYRKYRPNVSGYRGHYKEWWHFAYKCVLEGEVRRKKREWDWKHILQYRNMCKEYGYLYKKHVKQSANAEEKAKLEQCEKLLDITNIVITRQRIDMELERLGEKKGWLGWIWRRSADDSLESNKTLDILKQFESEMTPEEKSKLYKAIDYQENAGPAIFPEAYVDNSISFLLRDLEVELCDDTESGTCKTVLFSDLKSVRLKLETRPARSALKVNVKIDDLTTLGLTQQDFTPKLVTAVTDTKRGLLEVAFETNPPDGICDQRVHVIAQPLRIVYDAQTINKIVDIFKVPPDTALDQIQAAAGSGLTNVKEMTATGLQYAIDKHIRLDLDIDLQAPLVIIPYGGKYTGSENVLVANLGRVKVFSFGKRTSAADVREMHSQGYGQEDIFNRMKEHSYDTFKLELTDLQILMAQSDEDWTTAIRDSETSDMHLLNPLSLSISYSKCLIVDDPRLPLSRISGELPFIDINVSEARLMLLACLGTSIPLPESDVPQPEPIGKKRTSSMMLKYKELQDSAKHTKTLLNALAFDSAEKDFVQFTTLEAKFVISEFSITINQQADVNTRMSELASLKIKSLECKLTQQTYLMNVSLLLGSISLQQNRQGNVIDIISTPLAAADGECLFKVQFTQVDVNSPEFHSLHRSCESSLLLDFGVLGVVLHQEGLLSLIKFATELQDQITLLTEDKSKDRIARAAPSRRLSVISESLSEIQRNVLKTSNKRKVPLIVETIKFKLKAQLKEVTVKFATDCSNISSCAIRGITSDIIIKDTYTQVNAKLLDIAVIDLNPETLHSLIITCTEGVAMTTQIVLNNLEGESKKPDMDVTVKMGGMRIVFLNWFISNMLNFLNQFQAAQQKIIEASQAAAQSAKENMKDAYTKATKISLNIYIKAPDVIVPVDSRSLEALFLDLGVISLSNNFVMLEFKNEQGFAAVVDELKINLSQLKIARIALNNRNETVRESLLLEPINCNIILRRNLSTSWYTAIPDIHITGKIEAIKLFLSQADYQIAMKVLSGNLAEGQTDKVDKQIQPSKAASDVEQVAGMTVTSQVDVIVSERVEPKQEKVHVFLKFIFVMDELIINLFTGGAKTLTKDTPSHEEKALLGRFSLEGLSLKGRILSDQSIVTSVLLVNCLLEDMRKNREDKLNRLIERSHSYDVASNPSSSTSEAIAPRSMLDVTFQQKGNDMFADVRIYSFTIILSVEYLLKLADFFNVPEPQQQSKQTQTKSTTVIGNAETVKSKTVTSIQPPEKQTQMTVNLKLEKPDIILVEHMDNINTNAMILNSEILVKLRIAGPHQVINGEIRDLQLYTCNYNPAYRADTKGNVLHPVTISLAGSTPQDKGLHVELLVTDVRLSVSPATIELLNRVLVTMSKTEAGPNEETVDPFCYTDLWNQKPFEDTDFWFLKTDFAIEAAEVSNEAGIERIESRPPLQELCIISMPSIVVTIEAGVGNKTLPMLMLETCFKGSARNWSSQLSVEASLTMEMGYYNSRLALWEPLIEPVEVVKERRAVFVPWELKLEVSMNERDDVLDVASPVSDAGSAPVQPVMSIDVISENSLELTVTKTCLEVLQNLSKAFATAMDTNSIGHTATISAPFKVVNEIGEDVTLLLDQSAFRVAEGGSLDDINKSEGVPLQLKSLEEVNATVVLSKELLAQSQEKDRFLHVKINDKNCELALPVIRADKRFFLLNYRGDGHDNWGIISDVKIEDGVTLITLRSILQVHNHFSVPIDVYYMMPKDNQLELLDTVQPNAVLNLPLKAVYNPTSELFFTVDGHAISCSPFIWKNLQANLTTTKLLQCPLKDVQKGTGPFIIKVIGEIEQVYFEQTSRYTMASVCYNIHLRPAVIFKNCLPIDVVCCLDELADEFQVKAGDTLQLPSVDPGRNVLVIRIAEYLEKEWSCRKDIDEEPPEFSVWTFHSYDSPTKVSLDLGMHTLNHNGSFTMSLYCPFWMLNKTGLMLAYRKSRKTEKHEVARSPAKDSDENLNVQHHPPHFKGPILFSFNAKNFFGKKKASIRVDLGEWSSKFSLDVAGSSGVISCKANDMTYQIGVHNQFTYNSLTKQVTFTPYYVVTNNAPFPIEFQESDRPADPWLLVEPKTCQALWPRSELEDKLLRLRVADSHETSAPFLYTESHNTLLRLPNKYGGVNVDIQLTEGSVYINLVHYEDGAAPAILVNHTETVITYWEKDSIQTRSLQPKHYILYTWENPSGPRMLVWKKDKNKDELNDLRRDGCGEYPISDTKNIYWASFLDGMQRVLLFTEFKEIAEGAEASNLLEIIQQELSVSINGLGVSLVNNVNRQEIMYIGIASSGIIWETCKMNGRRYKPLSTKESTHIEAAYQKYLVRHEADSDEDVSQVVIDGKIAVDFSLGLITKPNKRKIKRTYETGVWLQVKNSPSQMQLHAKINRIQIDNQMFDCIFPVVLAPVPPPKSVAVDSGIKPFIEISIVQLLMKNSQIRQFKYFKVLIQEFHIKVDLGFVNAIVDLLEQAARSEEEERKLFLTDLKLVDEALYTLVSGQSIQQQKSFYDLLHFSPLKIHISFSMAAGSSAGQSASTPNFLNILLQGIGVTLTDLQDVVFKLAYFERNFTFLTQNQLITEATSHYVGQSVKQLYVLVLGLDVIGNPYGLVLGITKGVEDLFYEPFQGAIQGPGEFAEGLALGVKSLFGHTVGGAAGAMSRITGAMGKGIAALTFDDEYQRKRRDQLNKRPATAQEGLARSGKGLVMGVYSGVTGVFTKPVAGAREQGVEGFFKGLGKGAVGLVTRPVSGVVDFASGSFDVVKRAAECGAEEISRLRPPRFLPADGLVRPYNKLEAEGHKLLTDLHKGKYGKTDIYAAHYPVVEKKEVLLLTNKRIAYVCRNDIFGGWHVEWAYTWEELTAPPKVVPKGVLITTSEKKKKLFGHSDTIKTVLIGDANIKEEICLKIESLRGS